MITRFIADDKIVYLCVRREMQLASDNSWARRRLKYLSWRSRWIILCTLEQRMVVSHKISRADRCLLGLSSWLSKRSSTAMCRMWSTAAWLPDNCTRLVDSLADCRCFHVSDPSRETHATAFVHHTALTDRDLSSESHLPVKFSWFCLIFTYT